MRLLLIIVALAALPGMAGATSRAKQCRQACGGLIAACTKTNAAAGYGNLTHGCRQSVLKRCKHEGPAVCQAFCGNGTIDPGEQCDGANLGGASCQSLRFGPGTLTCAPGCTFDTSRCAGSPPIPFLLATGQTTCWDTTGTGIPCAGTGQDGDLRKGAPLAYMDNGDGTITDLNTGLTWEKQSKGDGSVHDIGVDSYNWGTAFSVHVAILNSMSFAGHTDWRMPNVRELASIVNYENVFPSVSPAFNNNCTSPCTVLTCSCTAVQFYWSSSSDNVHDSGPQDAWGVSFDVGRSDRATKGFGSGVRAVRGGS